MLLNLALAWLFGLLVLTWLWWTSMPARDVWMTLTAGASLLLALFTGATGFAALLSRMAEPNPDRSRSIWQTAPAMSAVLVVLPLVTLLSHQRTMGSFSRLAHIDLSGQIIVERPPGWLSHALARKDFLTLWCHREEARECHGSDASYNVEWRDRRRAARDELKKPSMSGRDLRGADLSAAFLVAQDLTLSKLSRADLSEAQLEGADLSGALLDHADFTSAQMEWAVLYRAQLNGANLNWAHLVGAELLRAKLVDANLSRAEMEGTELSWADMTRADLSWARLNGADMSGAKLEEANLSGAQMEAANLSGVKMANADLSGAQLTWANLNRARMQGTNLSWAQVEDADLRATDLQGAVLEGAQMMGTIFSFSYLTGELGRPNILSGTDLRDTRNDGGALRFLDFRGSVIDTRTDWRNSFGDGSVTLIAGMSPPCQWAPSHLNDRDFFARWRGWLEAFPGLEPLTWSDLAPDGFEDIPPIPPPDGCKWKTDPLP